MSFSILQTLRVGLVGCALALLASCGGSGGGDDNNGGGGGGGAASNTPPDSASASVTGFIAYLKTVVVTMPNTIEPLDVSNFVAPTVDNMEPDQTI